MSKLTLAQRRWSSLSAPVRGALWMIAASAGFASMIGIIRQVHVSAGLHPFEIAFFRNFFALVFMLPWLLRHGLGTLRTKRLGLYTVRAFLGLGAMLCWFWAITVMPLSDAVALSFTTPLFATVLAALILGEVVRARRWSATAIGFVGAMIILRPGFQELQPAALVVLAASMLMAGAVISVKALSRTEPTYAVVFYMVLFLTPASAIPALFVWQTPGWPALAWLAALGLIATFAHICITRAFVAADASAVMPFDFARLIFVALVGYVAFGERLDEWTAVGAAIIAATTVYIARREALAARTEAPAKESVAQDPNP